MSAVLGGGPRGAPAAASLGTLFRVFLRIGLLSFGGPAAQIALLHRELVEERGWIEERDFLAALSFCMLLPGPEAMQLATYTGWRLRGTLGGLIAGLLFVLPGAAIVLGLSVLYGYLGAVPLAQALFLGVQAAVLAIVLEALLRVARRALKTKLAWGIALGAFLAIFALGAPFPLILALAAIAGALGLRNAPAAGPAGGAPASLRSTLKTTLIWASVWLIPLGLLLWSGGLLAEIGVFFSQLALFTFGGAYAVLTWMTEAAVIDHGWLQPAEMVDGLGLAETTPGPLILVTEFVGYLAGFRQGGLALGLGAAIVTLWMTFAPSFLFVFAGAPWIGAITSRPRLAGALAGVTAAVTGVILNLALWFAAHVLFAEVGRITTGPFSLIAPNPESFNPVAGALALVAAYLIFRLHLSLPLVLAISAGLGLGLGQVL